MTYAFVLDKTGNKLSPTKENKAWYLIRKQRATLVQRFPMVIRLNKTIPKEAIDTTPIRAGIDDGAKYVGIALVQNGKTKNKPILKGFLEHRQDVKDKIDARRAYRRYRRSYKRYRPKRFHHRSSSKRTGRIPPTIRQKKEAVLRVIQQLHKWTRINFIHLEDVQIDIRAIENGYQPYRWEYHQSNRLDENIRKAVILRDQNTCQKCGRTNCRIEVHHIIPRRLGGSNSIYNLICLCSDCHKEVTGNELAYKDEFFQKINGRPVRYWDAMHVMQGKMYLRKELETVAPVILTTGGDTANKRIDWGIEKSHANDAIVITDSFVTNEQCAIKEWHIKPMRRRSNKKTDEVDGFRHRDVVRYTKRNGETYVGYITALYPDKKQCNLTTIDGKVLKRYGLNRLTLIHRFKNLYWF
ncbi:HNH endonuclease [Geobacillus subterraneus]|uniref:HNH endonuclease n=2 Tax=Geobacillus TaxID=129337 RepID=A0ABN4NK19_9BACL|nr:MULTISPECIES: RNA-guided endonuclease IscB [Geobacillus]AMX85017.1 HNH endonuclease [Geobacillus subterraneus]KZS25758.1 HNH endonuclease [Geobacillus subterraneus]OXB85216.1 HNH endonuclease [Geobacillus uzenensis]QIZ66153.1 HNH endonuclease [Geobacillus subterraneus]